MRRPRWSIALPAGDEGTSRSGCRTTSRPSWSASAPTRPSTRSPTTGRGGCTTAARSATAPIATHPTGTWPVVAARLAGLDLVNLGLGGSALLDPFVARTIRDTPADLISVKLGINLVNQDLMRRRVLGPAVHGWLDTIRDGHPDTPIRLVSPIFCGIHESVPGPTAPDMAAAGRGPGGVRRRRRPGRGGGAAR